MLEYVLSANWKKDTRAQSHQMRLERYEQSQARFVTKTLLYAINDFKSKTKINEHEQHPRISRYRNGFYYLQGSEQWHALPV